MFELLKKNAYPIGVDLADGSLRLAQLGDGGRDLSLVAGITEGRPDNLKPGSSKWQRWAIETMHLLASYGDFRGREVIAAMPTEEVFIDHVKMPKTNDGKLQDAVFSKIKQKLPFESLKENTVMKYVLTEEDNVLVMATERKIIDRHLAIYEKAGLSIKSMGVWPAALANCYAKFFGRRKSDLDAVVMLVCIEPERTNVVICRHKNLLLARSISIGIKQLDDEQVASRVVMELGACRRQFGLIYRKAQIERLIFLSAQAVDNKMCATIAKQLEMPAQVGDCLAAVRMADGCRLRTDRKRGRGRLSAMIDRGESPVNWAVAFGLSLS